MQAGSLRSPQRFATFAELAPGIYRTQATSRRAFRTPFPGELYFAKYAEKARTGLTTDGAEAVRLSTKGCELVSWRDSSLVDTLAAAHAETGDFGQAVKYQEQALQMRSTKPADRKGMEERLAGYRLGKPHREDSKTFSR